MFSKYGFLVGSPPARHATNCAMTCGLRCARRMLPQVDKLPPLFAFVTPEFNPAIGLSQFLSSMLAGEHEVLSVLTMSRGFHDLATFIKYEPLCAHVMRRALISSAISCHVRHYHRYKLWPWRLAVVADDRLSSQRRRAVAAEFLRSCEKCLDIGFCRTLRTRVNHIDMLFDPFWQRAIKVWASLIDCDMHDIEISHGFSKRSNCRASKFEIMAARSIARDAALALPCGVERAGCRDNVGRCSSSLQ